MSLVTSDMAPVVLNWHGLGGTGPLHTVATGFVDLADREGFVVVSPTGPPLGAEAATAWELDGFDEPGRDDVAFAASLIDDAVERFCGDGQRVYSIGMSNGGLFTSRLICELGERLAAAASVAGLNYPDDCPLTDPVPFVAYHGTADRVVPFDGTVTASVLEHPITAAFEGDSIAEEFAQFAEGMGCTSVVPTPVPPDVIRHDFADCDADVPLVFYEITDGGHTWPGPVPGDGSQTVDATADSWAFFKDQVRRDS
jgi:polyhydroxybutyrate depolymerase